jgi:hypothetical protein
MEEIPPEDLKTILIGFISKVMVHRIDKTIPWMVLSIRRLTWSSRKMNFCDFGEVPPRGLEPLFWP